MRNGLPAQWQVQWVPELGLINTSTFPNQVRDRLLSVTSFDSRDKLRTGSAQDDIGALKEIG